MSLQEQYSPLSRPAADAERHYFPMTRGYGRRESPSSGRDLGLKVKRSSSFVPLTWHSNKPHPFVNAQRTKLQLRSTKIAAHSTDFTKPR